MSYGLKRIGVASTALRSGNVELPVLGCSLTLPSPRHGGSQATSGRGILVDWKQLAEFGRCRLAAVFGDLERLGVADL